MCGKITCYCPQLEGQEEEEEPEKEEEEEEVGDQEVCRVK